MDRFTFGCHAQLNGHENPSRPTKRDYRKAVIGYAAVRLDYRLKPTDDQLADGTSPPLGLMSLIQLNLVLM